MEKREYCIRFIRSRLPYMGEQELDFLLGFTSGVTGQMPSSDAEYLRPVLSAVEQRNADSACRLMEAVRDALFGRNGAPACCITGDGKAQASGARIIGEQCGELAMLDVSAILDVFHAAGMKRVRRSDMLEGLETAGFILPRDRGHRTATIGGKQREVVYMPIALLHESEPSRMPATTKE